jgi:hypothetical protein
MSGPYQSTIGELFEEMDRGQMIFRRKRDNSRAVEIGQRIAKNNHCIGMLGGGRGKGDVEFLHRGCPTYRQGHAGRFIRAFLNAGVARERLSCGPHCKERRCN